MRTRFFWWFLLVLQPALYASIYYTQGWSYFGERQSLLDGLSTGAMIVLIHDYWSRRKNKIVPLTKVIIIFVITTLGNFLLVPIMNIGYFTLMTLLYPSYIFVLIFTGWKLVFRKNNVPTEL